MILKNVKTEKSNWFYPEPVRAIQKNKVRRELIDQTNIMI
jgi:hypothetical protein